MPRDTSLLQQYNAQNPGSSAGNAQLSSQELQQRQDADIARILSMQADPGMDQLHTPIRRFKESAIREIERSYAVLDDPNASPDQRRNAVQSIEKLQSVDPNSPINDPVFNEWLEGTNTRNAPANAAGTNRDPGSVAGDQFFGSRDWIAPDAQNIERELVTPAWAQTSASQQAQDPFARIPNTYQQTQSLLNSQSPVQYQPYQQAQLQQVSQRPWTSPATDPNQMISDRSINAMQSSYGSDPFAFVNRIDQTGINAQKNSIGYIDNLLNTPYQTSAFGTNPYAFSSGVDQAGKNQALSAANYLGSVTSSPAMQSAIAGEQSAFNGLRSNWENVRSEFGDDPFALSREVDQTGISAQRTGLEYFQSVMGDPRDPEGADYFKNVRDDMTPSESVSYLRELIANEGQDAASRAHYEQALQEAERMRAGNAQAALSELDRQGRGGGGMALMAQLQGQEMSMAQQYNAALEAAAMEQARKDQANMQRAQLMSIADQRRDLAGAQYADLMFAGDQRRDAAGVALMQGGNALRAQQFGEAALSAQQIDALRAARASGMDAFSIAKATGLDQFTVQQATLEDNMAIYDSQRRIQAATAQGQIGTTLYGQELNAAIAAAGGIDQMYMSEAARRDAANVNRAQIGYNLRNQQASEVFHAADSIDQMTAARSNLMAKIDEINSGRVYASSETYNQYTRALDQVNAQIANQQELYNTGVYNQEMYSQNRYGEGQQSQNTALLANALQQDAGRTVAVLSQQMNLDAQEQANFISALNAAASRQQQQQIIDAQLQQSGTSVADVLGVLAPVAGATIGGIAGGPVGAAIGGSIGGAGAAALGGSPTGLATVPTISQAFMPSANPYQVAPYAQYQTPPAMPAPYRAGVLAADQY